MAEAHRLTREKVLDLRRLRPGLGARVVPLPRRQDPDDLA
jgi:hypothetical protein